MVGIGSDVGGVALGVSVGIGAGGNGGGVVADVCVVAVVVAVAVVVDVVVAAVVVVVAVLLLLLRLLLSWLLLLPLFVFGCRRCCHRSRYRPLSLLPISSPTRNILLTSPRFLISGHTGQAKRKACRSSRGRQSLAPKSGGGRKTPP